MLREREREREREIFRVSGHVRIERERDLGFQENCGESERERREISEKSRVVCKIHRDFERRRSRAGSERVDCRGSIETWQAPQRMPPKMAQRIPSLTSSRTRMSSRSLRTKVRGVNISLITGLRGRFLVLADGFLGRGLVLLSGRVEGCANLVFWGNI